MRAGGDGMGCVQLRVLFGLPARPANGTAAVGGARVLGLPAASDALSGWEVDSLVRRQVCSPRRSLSPITHHGTNATNSYGNYHSVVLIDSEFQV